MPWFYRKLPVPVDDDFEVCICKDAEYSNEDLAVENAVKNYEDVLNRLCCLLTKSGITGQI